MRYIESDENLSQRGAQLTEAIENDIREGLIPFWVSLSKLSTSLDPHNYHTYFLRLLTLHFIKIAANHTLKRRRRRNV